jgi:hypothetical protein
MPNQFTPPSQSSIFEGKAGGPLSSDSVLPIIGNKRSHLFHRADCPNYSDISPKNQVEFRNEIEAQEAGYRIAGNCP